MKNFLSIEDDFVDTRLDKWFKKKVSNVPQSFIEKNLRKGNIKVNNKKVKSSYKVQKNDLVSIKLFNFKLNKIVKKKFQYDATNKEIRATSNLFIEDNENFVIINKPAGLAVQAGTKSKKNLIDILKKTPQFRQSSPYVVHRIDKETTGVLIIAKNRKFAQLFTSLFRLRKIHKVYLGVVVGAMQKIKGTLTDELISYEGNKKIISKAITHYNTLDTNSNYSLLKLTPETGRKHQLRKQLLIHGCPIVGDTKYRITLNKSKKNILMLHAYKINFSISEDKYSYSVDPPSEFKNFLKEKYLKNF
tara:strand:+ start:716 stop:1624 length:909 start_codon:yes stop_codon:yes gene_type:complete